MGFRCNILFLLFVSSFIFSCEDSKNQELSNVWASFVSELEKNDYETLEKACTKKGYLQFVEIFENEEDISELHVFLKDKKPQILIQEEGVNFVIEDGNGGIGFVFVKDEVSDKYLLDYFLRSK